MDKIFYIRKICYTDLEFYYVEFMLISIVHMGPCWCIRTHMSFMSGPHELGTRDPGTQARGPGLWDPDLGTWAWGHGPEDPDPGTHRDPDPRTQARGWPSISKMDISQALCGFLQWVAHMDTFFTW